ncbi:hypothetical protein NQZ68_018435 [Dissostichus eleginoides]|nr:hypothetical protein NQZ68_018435 [Dissostichus eleginoides]
MPKTPPSSKGNPQLSDVEGLGCCDCQYYHIRVNFSRNDTGWLNASMNSLPSLAACFSLQTFGEIFIPHDINSADMLQLRQDVWSSKQPTKSDLFLKGNFAVKKTTRSFSAIVIGQAHEQNNASVKDDGGAVGLTENPAALRRWMVSGPEMARVVGEFEASTEKRKKTDTRHHEQTKHAQMAFA